VVSSEVKLAILGAIILVLRRIYVVIEGIVAAAGIEVVGKAIKVVVYVLVIAEVYSLEAVFKVFKVSKVYKV
jgi:hypothetical protein